MLFKKVIIPLLILILVGGVAFWLISQNDESTLDVKSTNFSVKDTALIDKLKLSNMSGGSVTLSREKGNQWKVNGKFNANSTKVKTLLTTIRNVEVKNPVSISRRENVVKSLASQNIQVDIFQNGELVRSYFVGHQTPDEMGTYMAMNNKEKKPYVVHIPGFYGYLSSRYFINPQKWRTKKLFAFNPVSIRKVSIQYSNNPQNSFILEVQGNDEFVVSNSKQNKTLQNPKSSLAKKFLVQFKDMRSESSLKGDSRKQTLDSLQNRDPLFLVKVNGKSDKKREVAFYRAGLSAQEEEGHEASDMKRFYAIANHRPNDVLLMQRRVVEPILKRFRDFESEKIN